MVSLLGTAAAVVTAAAGVGVLAFGVDATRRWDAPGLRAYLVFLGLLAVGAVGSAAAVVGDSPQGVLVTVTTAASFASVPWVVFALQYTGRGHLVTRRSVALIAGPTAVLWLANLVVSETSAVQALGVSSFLYGIVLVVRGASLLLQTTARHGYLSVGIGLALGTAAVEPWFLSIAGFAVGSVTGLVLYWVAAGGFLFVGGLLAVAQYRFDAFEGTAAAGMLGRRAIVAESDDLVAIVDEDERVVAVNDATEQTLGVDRDTICGESLQTTFDTGVDSLSEADTYELTTAAGRRTFDAQVVPLRDGRDRVQGYLVSLRDVTERQIRTQRLAVLNRVLRHNLSNKLTSIRGYTRHLAEEYDDEYAQRAATAAADLVGTSKTAREAQQIFDREAGTERVSLAEIVETAVDNVTEETTAATDADRSVTLETTVPDQTVELEARLLRVAVENLLENAVQHHDGDPEVEVSATVDEEGSFPLVVRVTDDGPGLPDHERAPISAGEETALQHGSGVGLWVVEWAVTRLGGTVTFAENEPRGTVVELRLPASVVVDTSKSTSTLRS
jgi:PAS domain S-box-containing protein